MKKSIYMLNLLLTFFFTLASSVWKAEYYVILVSCSIDMNVIAVGFFPFVKSSFSNRNNE